MNQFQKQILKKELMNQFQKRIAINFKNEFISISKEQNFKNISQPRIEGDVR